MSFQPLDSATNIDPFTTVSFTGYDAKTGIYFDADPENSSVLIQTNNTPALYVDKFQNMGINTLSPSAQLDVNSANSSHIQLTYNGSATSMAKIGVTSDGKLSLVAGGSEVNVDTTTSFNIKSHNALDKGLMLGNALVRATADQLNFNIVSPGTATANKALVVNAGRNIENIASLTADELNGTIKTAAQPYISSVDILDITGHTGVSGLSLGGVLVSSTAEKLNYVDTTPGTAAAFKALVLNGDRNVSNIHSLTADEHSGTVKTAAQPNITSVGTLQGLSMTGNLTGLTDLSINTTETGRTLVINHEDGNCFRMYHDVESSAANYVDLLVTSAGSLTLTPSGGDVDITSHDGASQGLKLGSVLVKASADQINYLEGTNPGSAAPDKALITDANSIIANINSLTATSLTGTIQTPAQPNIASVNALNIATHDGSTVGLKLNGTLVKATADELNYVDTTPGAAEPLKALVLDGNKDVSGVHALSANELTGTLQTAAQPNVTSVGTLTSLAGDVTVAGTTLSGTELAVIDAVVPGTAAAGKALVLDGTSDVTGIHALTAAEITGTIQTAAQPNITSVTTLNVTGHDGAGVGLALDGTPITATAAELNYVDTTPGTAAANKALVLNGQRDIENIHALTADQLTGTIQTAVQPNITSVGTLTSLAVSGDVSLSRDEVVVLDNVTPGTVSPSKALVVERR